MGKCVSFLSLSVCISGWGGYNQAELGRVTSCSQGRAVSLASGTSRRKHRATVAGSACAALGRVGWPTRAGYYSTSSSWLPFPEQSRRCSASCWGKPWTPSVHLPQPANSGRPSVRGCCASWALSSWTDPVSRVSGTRDPWHPDEAVLCGGEGTGDGRLDRSCSGPKHHRRVNSGDSEGSGLQKRQGGVMRWLLSPRGVGGRGTKHRVSWKLECQAPWLMWRQGGGGMLLGAWLRCWFSSPHMLCAGYPPSSELSLGWSQGWRWKKVLAAGGNAGSLALSEA